MNQWYKVFLKDKGGKKIERIYNLSLTNAINYDDGGKDIHFFFDKGTIVNTFSSTKEARKVFDEIEKYLHKNILKDMVPLMKKTLKLCEDDLKKVKKKKCQK
jgi:hypothetical protein